MSIADSPITAACTAPPAEIPGPEDWFVWDEESASSPTKAMRICFRSWLSPGRWMSELATVCNSARA